MRPEKNIEKLIKNIDIDTNSETDKAVLEDILKAFETSKKPASIKKTASGGKAAAKKNATRPETLTKASNTGKSSSQKVVQKASSQSKQSKTSKSKTPPKMATKKVQPGAKTARKEGLS